MGGAWVARSVRVIAAVAVGLVTAQALVGCASAGQTAHKTYSYKQYASPGKVAWHPGEHIAVTWAPVPGPDTTARSPKAVTIQMQLFGPYPTREKVNEVINKPTSLGATAVSLSMAPLSSDTWSGKTLSGELVLPATLAPGFYDLEQTVVEQTSNTRDTFSGGLVLQIAT